MLRGEKIYLRALEPEDAELIFKWENDPDNWKVSNTLLPFSRHLIKQYVNTAQDVYVSRQARFIIETLDKTPVGAIDLFDFEPLHLRAGVGILIAEAANRNKGYASEALSLLVNYSFKHLQLQSLFCNILDDNEESKHLFTKAGFQIKGIKERWHKTPTGMKNELFLQLFND